MLSPTVLVLFGATGDLVAKKILPSLLSLYQKKMLPKEVSIVAFGRRDMTDDAFQEYVREVLEKRKNDTTNSNDQEAFIRLFSYQRGQFDVLEDYQALATRLHQCSKTWSAPAGFLYYLAVPPELTQPIFNSLAESGLSQETDAARWRRVIVEKPIGINAKTADDIEATLCKTFQESQIYRIDHYLAKEMVQNILRFRFSNSLFEGIWNNQFIEKIDIRLWESIGVENRGAFYDGLGTLRDVGQNHLLQMLAFVTMDHPQDFAASAIRRRRAEVLNTLEILPEEKISTHTFRAQYDGYKTIGGVQSDSMTETFFKLEACLDTPRWKNVPIRMEAGKRLGKARKEIVVTFRPPQHCMCHADQDEHQKNVIIFGLEPMEGIQIEFWSKKPGLNLDIEKRTLDFLLRAQGERSQYIEEYEKLLLDGFLGDQTLFVDHDEIRAMWRYIDPIVTAWQRNAAPLHTYPPDTSAFISSI